MSDWGKRNRACIILRKWLVLWGKWTTSVPICVIYNNHSELSCLTVMLHQDQHTYKQLTGAKKSRMKNSTITVTNVQHVKTFIKQDYWADYPQQVCLSWQRGGTPWMMAIVMDSNVIQAGHRNNYFSIMRALWAHVKILQAILGQIQVDLKIRQM
jgi:hypothetical protein